MIEIDGSFGSAGGQILRTACALSAVTKKPCHIFNIRKARPKPGLAFQHLLGIQALSQLCGGKLEGDRLGSEEIRFYPGKIENRPLKIKIETAGSITLVLQTLIPAAVSLASPRQALEPINPVRDSKNSVGREQISNGVKICFEGGATDTFFSPSFDYFRYVFLKILEKMGIKSEVDVLRRGYYPEGGAKVAVTIYPSTLKPINRVERGGLKQINIISGASEFLKDKKVAERQITGTKQVLSSKLNLPIQTEVEYYHTDCPGSQINIIGEFENTIIGVDNLGKLGKSAEVIGKEAAQNFLKEGKTNACIDKHLSDQILPYMALASGESQISVSEITPHCKTNVWVIEKFINGKFDIKNNLITWTPW